MRLRPKGKPDPQQYKTKKEMLGLLEKQSAAGNIALYDADETRISETGYVPYAWQFADEDCCIEAQRGKSMNCFGLFSRANEFIYKNTAQHIHADFIVSELDDFSLKIKKETVGVLDNASAHQSKKVVKLLDIWKQRGLHIFYLPPYSPQLNIMERLWKEIKEGWIKPEDYKSADSLFYALDRICANIGKNLSLDFKPFSVNPC